MADMDDNDINVSAEDKEALCWDSLGIRYKMQQRAHGFILYGQNRLQRSQWMHWYDTITEYAGSINCSFTMGSCDPGNGDNYVPLLECKRAMANCIDNIENVTLRGSPTEHCNIYSSDPIYCTTGAYSTELKYLFAHDSSYGTFDDFIMMNLKMLYILKPQYGFYYDMPIVSGAYSYDCGDSFDYSDYMTVDQDDVYFDSAIVEWFRNFKKYVDECMRCGKLREVYPINILNEAHLNNKIFHNTTLQQWINADSTRGILLDMTDELWLWMIDDQYLQQITEELAQSDVLLIVNRKNPKRYDYGLREEDQFPLSTVIRGRTVEEWALMQLKERS